MLIKEEQIKKLKEKGYKVVGEYRRNRNYIYVIRKGDPVATPHCLNDDSRNRIKLR